MAISSGRVKTATYLYCVIRSSAKPALAGVPAGVPYGSSPGILKVSGDFWVAASSVRLDVYGAGSLESLLRDIDAVGRVAMAHEAVVEYFAHHSGITVVPMKLFTMFSTPARAVADIASRRTSLDSAMTRVEGAEEWGVRVTRGGQSPARERSSRGHTSGAAFLAARKQARDDVRSAQLAAAEAAAAVLDRLTAISRDTRVRTDPPASGVTPPLLDAAFLVSTRDREKFNRAARELANGCSRVGAHMTMTGPWPAYNFIEVDDDRRAAPDASNCSASRRRPGRSALRTISAKSVRREKQ